MQENAQETGHAPLCLTDNTSLDSPRGSMATQAERTGAPEPPPLQTVSCPELPSSLALTHEESQDECGGYKEGEDTHKALSVGDVGIGIMDGSMCNDAVSPRSDDGREGMPANARRPRTVISTLTLERETPYDRMARHLQQLSIFRDLPAEFFLSLAQTMRIIHHGVEDYIVRKGEVSAALYYLNKGGASVVSVDGGTVFTQLDEGSFFGETSLLFAYPASASIRCDKWCEVYRILKEDLDAVLLKFPDVNRQIKEVAKGKMVDWIESGNNRDYDSEFRLHPLRLTFRPDLEYQYMQTMMANSWARIGKLGVVLLLMTAACLLWPTLQDEGYALESVGGCLGLGAVGCLWLYLLRRPRQHAGQALYTPLATALYACLGLMLAAQQAQSTNYWDAPPLTLAALLFCVFVMTPLRWWGLVIANGLVLLGYAALVPLLNPVAMAHRKQTYLADVLFLGSALAAGGLYAYWAEYSARRVYVQEYCLLHYQAQVQAETEKAQQLLRCIFPESIAKTLHHTEELDFGRIGREMTSEVSDVTILAADLMGFTPLCSSQDPGQVVGFLNDMFTEFDRLADKYALEKIKTIGDCYLVCAGVPEAIPNHAKRIVDFGLDIIQAVREVSQLWDLNVNIRVGVNTGSVVAGAIGLYKVVYDVWGPDVDQAFLMESTGTASQVHVSEATWLALRDTVAHYVWREGPPQTNRNKRTGTTTDMRTWFIEARRSKGKMAHPLPPLTPTPQHLHEALERQTSTRSFLDRIRQLSVRSLQPPSTPTSEANTPPQPSFLRPSSWYKTGVPEQKPPTEMTSSVLVSKGSEGSARHTSIDVDQTTSRDALASTSADTLQPFSVKKEVDPSIRAVARVNSNGIRVGGTTLTRTDASEGSRWRIFSRQARSHRPARAPDDRVQHRPTLILDDEHRRRYAYHWWWPRFSAEDDVTIYEAQVHGTALNELRHALLLTACLCLANGAGASIGQMGAQFLWVDLAVSLPIVLLTWACTYTRVFVVWVRLDLAGVLVLAALCALQLLAFALLLDCPTQYNSSQYRPPCYLDSDCCYRLRSLDASLLLCILCQALYPRIRAPQVWLLCALVVVGRITVAVLLVPAPARGGSAVFLAMAVAVVAATVAVVRTEVARITSFSRRSVVDQRGTQVKRLERHTDTLLLNVLPSVIIKRMKTNASGTPIAEAFSEASILFAELRDLGQNLSPMEEASILAEVYTEFDIVSAILGCEKVKTMGRTYMATAGVPLVRLDHATALATLALAMRKVIERINVRQGKCYSIRIGLNTGPLVAGVIGTQKFCYDVWGDSVNVASRIETSCPNGCIQISAAMRELLEEHFKIGERGPIKIKGKGSMHTYYLLGKKQHPQGREGTADVFAHLASAIDNSDHSLYDLTCGGNRDEAKKKRRLRTSLTGTPLAWPRLGGRRGSKQGDDVLPLPLPPAPQPDEPPRMGDLALNFKSSAFNIVTSTDRRPADGLAPRKRGSVTRASIELEKIREKKGSLRLSNLPPDQVQAMGDGSRSNTSLAHNDPSTSGVGTIDEGRDTSEYHV